MCKLCKTNPVSPSIVMDKVCLSITFNYKGIHEDDLDKFCEHIVDRLCFDHDDGNFDLIYNKLNDEDNFTIAVLITDNAVALVNDVKNQVEQALLDWNRSSSKFKCD